MKKKAIIFDLDGTLIDSIKDIALCANQVLEELGYKTHKLDDYRKFVGDGALMLITNSLPKNTDNETIAKALELFKKIYGDTIHENTKPYSGIYEMLKALKNSEYKLTVLSNKPHPFTIEFIDYFFGNFPFVEIHGQKENIPKKPHPKGALNIIDALKLSKEEIIFIGDTPTDIKTAQNAGVLCIGVAWGYRGAQELIDAKANFVVKTPYELTELLLKNNF